MIWTHLIPRALPSSLQHIPAVTTSRAACRFSVALEVLRRWPKCQFAPAARVCPQWRLARAQRCRSGRDTSTCAGVEGVVAVRRFYRQTAALPPCWSFFSVAFFITIPFLSVSSFPCHSLLLLGCCSNDIVFAAAPSRSSFFTLARMSPTIPPLRSCPLSLAMNQTAFHTHRQASYVTKRRRGRGALFTFTFFIFSSFCFLPFPSLLPLCVAVLFLPSVQAFARNWCVGRFSLQSEGWAMCGSDSEGRPLAFPTRW